MHMEAQSKRGKKTISEPASKKDTVLSVKRLGVIRSIRRTRFEHAEAEMSKLSHCSAECGHFAFTGV